MEAFFIWWSNGKIIRLSVIERNASSAEYFDPKVNPTNGSDRGEYKIIWAYFVIEKPNYVVVVSCYLCSGGGNSAI